MVPMTEAEFFDCVGIIQRHGDCTTCPPNCDCTYCCELTDLSGCASGPRSAEDLRRMADRD